MHPSAREKCLPKKHFLRFILTMLFFTGTVTGISLTASGQVAQKKLISVTDIHFNPFDDPSLAEELAAKPYSQWDAIFSKSKNKTPSPYKEETNPALLQKLLNTMKKKSNGISAVIFSGDILAHHFNDMIAQYTGAADNYERNRFIYKTVGYISMKMKKTFRGVPVYFSLGNNDSYNGDYALVDDGEFLHTTADLFFGNFIIKKNSKDDFYKTFPQHGYYSVPFPAIRQGRIIGLNTIFFSIDYSAKTSNDPGKAELDWLEKELAKAKQANEKVWLLLHIPPGVNVYDTQEKSTGQNTDVNLFWKTGYNRRYLKLVQQYGEVIAAAFAGHTHMDDFRMIYNSAPSTKRQAVDFIHISASVSPVFGNNPAFQIISFNPQSGELTESVTWYMNLAADTSPAFKQEYVYSSTYGIPPNLTGLESLYPKLVSDSTKRNSYIDLYPVSSANGGISDVWQWYWCGIGNLTPADYTACKQLP
jgi:sphingomyelin phosphodiesterase acid-like 3